MVKRKGQGFVLGVALCFFLAGAGWEGIEISKDERGSWVHNAHFPDAIDVVHEKTREMDLKSLAARCRGVVNEHLRWRSVRDEKGAEEGREWLWNRMGSNEWLLCAVFARRVGEEGDTDWLDVLEEFYPLWRELFPGGEGPRTRSPGQLLMDESRDAYAAIFIEPLSDEEFLQRWVEMRLGDETRTLSVMSVSRRFNERLEENDIPVKELLALYEHPNAEVRHEILRVSPYRLPREADELLEAFVDRMADSNKRVRGAATVRVTRRPPDVRGRPALTFVDYPLVLPLLRFIARDDIDEEARAAALEGLRVRGYSVASAPDGRPIAVPVEGHARLGQDGANLLIYRFIRENDERRRESLLRSLYFQGYELSEGPEGEPVAVSIRDDSETIVLPDDD